MMEDSLGASSKLVQCLAEHMPHWQLQACSSVLFVLARLSFNQTCYRRYDINEMISAKTQLQLVQDEGQSHVMLDLDFKVCKAQTSCASPISIVSQQPWLTKLLLKCRARTGTARRRLAMGAFMVCKP